MKFSEISNVGQFLNPYWTIKILKERIQRTEDRAAHFRGRADFWENCTLKAMRDMHGMGKGIRRLVARNKSLTEINKHLERRLKVYETTYPYPSAGMEKEFFGSSQETE